jgi:hypothetical protein
MAIPIAKIEKPSTAYIPPSGPSAIPRTPPSPRAAKPINRRIASIYTATRPAALAMAMFSTAAVSGMRCASIARTLFAR